LEKIDNNSFQVRMPIILAIGIAAGILIGATFAGQGSTAQDFARSVLKFREVMGYIEKAYVDEVDSDELVENAITNMLEKLDPHTVYIPAKDVELTNSDLKGEFEGIGIEFNIFRDTIIVLAPLSGGPSEKVGLQAGDKIVTVDGETVAGTGINNRGVIDRLRGPKGTKVEVGILRGRNSKLMNFTIVRDKIPQYSVDAGYMIDKEIGYIKISRFAESTYDEFREKLNSLMGQGMKKLIIDLQSNPGGYMDRAVNIADELIGANSLIVSQEGKEPRSNAEYRAYRKGLFEEGGLIVLINEGSASGSEIVAGAVQDNDRGLIVGRRSFGKGLVQSMFRLSDGSELRLTISRYYTPSGRSIQRPYENGLSEYHNDFAYRVEHGELFYQDSIKFADSLQYTTSKGRKVYGGGGIMPDYFVPLDTSFNTMYYSDLLSNNVLREYALNYAEKNKRKLSQKSFEDFLKNFGVGEEMLQELIQLGRNNGVEYNAEQYGRSRELIRTVVKAWIAQSVWDREKFYPVINEVNEAYRMALTLFDKAEALAKQ
jgi:carboxyl-terminal processing protease